MNEGDIAELRNPVIAYHGRVGDLYRIFLVGAGPATPNAADLAIIKATCMP